MTKFGKKHLFGSLGLVLCLTTQLPAYADGQTSDSQLATQIHMVNQMEVRAGLLAKSRGGTPQIKRYGDRLVKDHQLADRLLLNVAHREGFTVANQPVHAMTGMEALQKAHGPDFDSQFLTLMQQGHTKTIAELTEAEKQLPPDSELKGLVAKLIPILKQHDELAMNLEKKGA
jgi:putative membrane protein